MSDALLVTSPAANRGAFPAIAARLCEVSVRKAHDPFLDIPWDAPESKIDPRDPRFELRADDPLGATSWYASQEPELRARLGLEMLCQTTRFGIEAETTLSRGLLAWIEGGSQEASVFRYALHEVIEECRHSLMFRTFIDRSGSETHGYGMFNTWHAHYVVRIAPRFPELFFFYVLAGEIFVDADNRARLAHRSRLHPLVARIMQIHVTEEARHVRFAESFLREYMPRLRGPRLWWMRAIAPVILSGNAQVMLQPSAALQRRFRIPHPVMREAYGPGTAHRERVRRISEPVRALLYPPARATLGHAHPHHQAD